MLDTSQKTIELRKSRGFQFSDISLKRHFAKADLSLVSIVGVVIFGYANKVVHAFETKSREIESALTLWPEEYSLTL